MPLLFPGSPLHPPYSTQRDDLVSWAQGLLNCSQANVKQCLTDIENIGPNQVANLGATALRVRIIGDHGTSIPANPTAPLLNVNHHSHGTLGANSSCSLFWVTQPAGGYAKIVGVASHVTNVTYRFEWVAGNGFVFSRAQPGGPLPAVNATINPF
jgi:hypothetical protein